jgi:integrase/recombinase XerC
MNPADVDGDQLRAWFAGKEWRPETRRSRRTTLRHFYRWLIEAGVVTVNVAERLPRVKPATPIPRPAPNLAVTTALANATPRERLMVRLAREAGLRRNEVAVGHTRDLVEDLEGWSLIVHGKGARDRLVPLTESLAAELRAMPAGYFFPGDVDGHLSAQWVGILVARLMPGAWTMHTLRHRFATEVYDVSHDLAATQDLLGHASPATTRVYVASDRRRLRALVEEAA